MTRHLVGTVLRACGASATLLFSAAASSAPHFVVNYVKVMDIGTVGGPIAGARDINDRGEVVGWGDQNAQLMGFLWTAGVSKTLLGPGVIVPSDMTTAWRINDTGDACGLLNSSWPNALDAITWKASGSTILMPSSAHDDLAFDINAAGSMTGYTSGNVAWRWILSGNVVTQSQRVPWPASTGYADGEGHGINDRSAVVGRFYVPSIGGWHAFFWDGRASKSIDLGVLPRGITSEAEDLNENRFIAGHASEQYSATPVLFRERAFLYHTDFGMYALPSLPGMAKSDSCRAYALNEWNSGDSRLQIVGECDLPGGTRAVVWNAGVTLVP